ncbi:MAG: hypothetical protein ACFFDI_17580, partial [Promethearchaeota archaeon]
MRFTTYVISDPNEFLKMAEVWDSLIYECSENPILLSRFIKEHMEHHIERGFTPAIMVIKNENEVVALAPLMMSKRPWFNSVKFMIYPDC